MRKPERSEAVIGDQIVRPPVRYRLDEYGRKVRVYECAYCRDVEIVSLPPYQKDETDADLLGMGPVSPRYAYPCPLCKGMGEDLLHNPLHEIVKERLRRWKTARKAELDRVAAEDQGQRLRIADVVRAAQGVSEAMPALSGMEAQESD